MNSPQESPQPTNAFEQKRLRNQIETDHATALRSEKLGRKLVSKTVKLIASGTSEKRFFSPSLSWEKADPASVTLALNSQLRSRDINAEAVVTVRSVGMPSDPSYHNILKLTAVEGKTIDSPDNRPL